jgi:hypothetical protein
MIINNVHLREDLGPAWPSSHLSLCPEAKFLDVIGTKVFLLAIPRHQYQRNLPPPPPPEQNGLKLVCNVNIVQYMETSSLGTLKIMPRNLNKIVRS